MKDEEEAQSDGAVFTEEEMAASEQNGAESGKAAEHPTEGSAELSPEERIYGMGQYQQSCLNLKGCVLELAQRNSQASVPFMI